MTMTGFRQASISPVQSFNSWSLLKHTCTALELQAILRQLFFKESGEQDLISWYGMEALGFDRAEVCQFG